MKFNRIAGLFIFVVLISINTITSGQIRIINGKYQKPILTYNSKDNFTMVKYKDGREFIISGKWNEKDLDFIERKIERKMSRLEEKLNILTEIEINIPEINLDFNFDNIMVDLQTSMAELEESMLEIELSMIDIEEIEFEFGESMLEIEGLDFESEQMDDLFFDFEFSMDKFDLEIPDFNFDFDFNFDHLDFSDFNNLFELEFSEKISESFGKNSFHFEFDNKIDIDKMSRSSKKRIKKDNQ